MYEKLASSLGRNDDTLNIEYAELISNTENKEHVSELVLGLSHKNTAISSDCIKVLYEIGKIKPVLISDYAPAFINTLNSKNNRLVWGSMIALASIANYCSCIIYENIEVIKNAYLKGSVITRDNSISIFATLCKVNVVYSNDLFPLLIQHLETCRAKEIPQHAEKISICISPNNIVLFKSVLLGRIEELTDTQSSRIKKLINRLDKTANH